MNKVFKKIKRFVSWKVVGKIADISGVIALIVLIFQVIPGINRTKTDINFLTEQVSSTDAGLSLKQYFYYIEIGELNKARNMFTEEKKKNQSGGLTGFINRHSDIVAFEGLTITILPNKTSATQQVYLVEYGFKKRGKKVVDSKQGFSLQFDGENRKINYSTSLLYENGWKEGACGFYEFDHCK